MLVVSRYIARLAPLAALLPYALGLFFIEIPLSAEIVRPLLERCLYFWLLFLLWALTLHIAFRWFLDGQRISRSTPSHIPQSERATKGVDKEKALPTSRPFFQIPLLVISACGFLLVLQFFRAKLDESVFALSLFTLGAMALRMSYQRRSQLLGTIFARFLSTVGIGWLSFLLVKPDIGWEPLLICAACGAIAVARDLTYVLAEHSSTPVLPELETTSMTDRRFLCVSRAALMGFVLAPTLVASLCYLGKLPTEYVLIFGIFPLLLPLAERLRSRQVSSQEAPFLRVRSDMIFVTFTAILIGVSLLRRL